LAGDPEDTNLVYRIARTTGVLGVGVGLFRGHWRKHIACLGGLREANNLPDGIVIQTELH